MGSLPKVPISIYNTDNLPNDWLCSPESVQQVEDCITRLAEQDNLDQEYDIFCNRVLTEMDDKRPSRKVIPGGQRKLIKGHVRRKP